MAGNDHCQTPRSGRQLGDGWLWLPTPRSLQWGEDMGAHTPPRVEEGRDKEEPFTPPKAALRGDGNQSTADLGPVGPSTANVAQGRGCIANEYTAGSRNPCGLASGSGGLRGEPGGRGQAKFPPDLCPTQASPLQLPGDTQEEETALGSESEKARLQRAWEGWAQLLVWTHCLRLYPITKKS